MQKVNILSFAQLRNAEHVAFFNNVSVALTKTGAEALGMTADQLTSFKLNVDTEQDIVNRSMASVYTPEMKEMDDERDRLFRLIRYKLQAAALESPESDVAEYASTINTYLLSKYGIDIVGEAYQAETAMIRGFVLDVQELLPPSTLKLIGISDNLEDLERVNDRFSDQYNERVTEKAQTDSELALKLREITEEQYRHIVLHVEYKANSDTTEVGKTCDAFVSVLNQLIKDAKRVLNLRLGKGTTEDVDDVENMEG